MPLPLTPGSRIGVFAPSGIHDPHKLEAGLAVLRSWDLEPVLAPHLGRSWRYLAASDEERLQDLHWALTAPHLQAAWLARGGYGLTRLLPHIRWGALRRCWRRLGPRPVLGFSDATALFAALWNRGLGQPVHAPVVQNLGLHVDEPTRQAVHRLLFTGTCAPWQGRVVVPGRAWGPLVGGNLCTLASLAGTRHGLKARGALLLLEDVGEAPYRLDRFLTQLSQAGLMDGIQGVVLGDWVGCDPPEGAGWTTRQVVEDPLSALGLPVVADIPVGHGPQNRPFVVGTPYTLEDGVLAPTCAAQ